MRNTIVNFWVKSLLTSVCSFFFLCASETVVFAEPRHSLFSDILSVYVKDGKIDYKNLKEDSRFPEYISQLQETDPERILDQDARMAFWINAYNAFTIKVILDNYPLKSINELHKGGLILGSLLNTTIWDQEIFEVNQEKISLGFIEHEILRKEFDDPRIHFAIVCASRSCPSIRNEAYEGQKIDQQLADQARLFLRDKDKNRFDPEKNTAYLSPIFKWFKKDFGKNHKEVLLYASQFLSPDLARPVVEDRGDWKIKYTYYDWGLNDW